jgi:2-desacetyl-2-hydroxyethyl bacteriochlorophyllide A dehydrogenase
MRALVYLGPRRLEVQDVPEPVAGRGEIVIAARASAICGSDLHGFREASPRRIPPLVMGHETVGEIAAVGEGIDPARVGERVVLRPALACGECALCIANRPNLCRNGRLVGRDLGGGFAERFVVPASAGVPIDDDVPDDLATMIEPVANAVHVTTRAVAPGDRVLVIGAGPIGALMVRGAVLAGAASVFATDPVAERLAFARGQGASALTSDDPATEIAERTEGNGVDVVIDAAGFAATWALAVQAVRPGGRIEVVGLGAPAGSVDYFAVIGKEAVITGSFAWTDEDFMRAVSLVEGAQIDATGWFTAMPLGEGADAFERLVDGSGLFKVVLQP